MNNHKTSDELMRNVLCFIIEFKRMYGGCSPSMREIAEHVMATRGGSCSTSYISFVLDQMVEKNMIVQLADLESRNIVVPGFSWRANEVENGD